MQVRNENKVSVFLTSVGSRFNFPANKAGHPSCGQHPQPPEDLRELHPHAEQTLPGDVVSADCLHCFPNYC